MAGTHELVKSAAVEAYVTLCGADARRLRALDVRNEDRCRAAKPCEHALAALSWICRAHDMGADDGVAAMYSMVEGWMGSYPETTGYIIPTMFDAADRLGTPEYRERAIEMGRWLLTCQLANGAFPGSFVGQLSEARVFNTGQALFGLRRMFAETDRAQFLTAASAGGDWLLSQLDNDGAWRRSTLNNIAHAYNVRTGWALLQLAHETGKHEYRQAAIANANWTVRQQDESGWFRNNTFRAGDTSATLHTIVYTIRGLLEIGHATDTNEFLNAADRAAAAVHYFWQRDRRVAGAYASEWHPMGDWRCVPGEAQLAIAWTRLDQIRKKPIYREATAALLQEIMATQLMNTSHPDLLGGISGSVPINGPYERYCLVSWGAKFLIDAILMNEGDNGDRCPSA